MVKKKEYLPDRGDIVWLQFDLQAGNEKAGLHPALVVSPQNYNGKVGLALFCLITSQVKGYPFEVDLPEKLPVTGVILADQVKNLDWQERGASFCCAAPPETVLKVLKKLRLLI